MLSYVSTYRTVIQLYAGGTHSTKTHTSGYRVDTTVMTAIQLPGSLVSVEWLAAAILPLSNGEWSFGEQIVVIDASLRALTHGATPLEDFLDVRIPGAFYFDFSTDNKGEGIPPHMLPSAK